MNILITFSLIAVLFAMFSISLYYNNKTSAGKTTNFKGECSSCSKDQCHLHPNYKDEEDDNE